MIDPRTLQPHIGQKIQKIHPKKPFTKSGI